MGNLSAIFGFTLSVILNVQYLGGSQTCIFFLAPLLLLMNFSDNFMLFNSLNESNRYFPIIAATSVFLIGSAIYDLALRNFLMSLGWISPSAPLQFMVYTTKWTFVAFKNLLFLIMTLPSHYYFNQFLWSFPKQTGFLWLLISPINIVPAFFANLSSIQMLGVLGLLAGAIQFLYRTQIQRFGREVI